MRYVLQWCCTRHSGFVGLGVRFSVVMDVLVEVFATLPTGVLSNLRFAPLLDGPTGDNVRVVTKGRTESRVERPRKESPTNPRC